MSADQTLLYLYTETLLHAGTGSGLSSIDLPIQRERTTHYPTVAGSSIKGKLRATAKAFNELAINVVELFGPERENPQAQQAGNATGQATARRQDHAGALIIGDAQLLLFPVRSLYGIFAYTTSYYALHRFMRDAQLSLQSPPNWKLEELPEPLTSPSALVTHNSNVMSGSTLVLEEFSFEAEQDENVTKIVSEIADWLATHALPQYGQSNTYFADKLKCSLVILSDDDFRDFISYSTEVVTRISMNSETKTAADTGLWTEENLPSDTLLYVPVYATQSRVPSGNQGNGQQRRAGTDILTSARKLPPGAYMQLGGDETVGRGIARTRWAEE